MPRAGRGGLACLAVGCALWASPAIGQTEEAQPKAKDGGRLPSTASFLAGAASGFLLHESAHLVADTAFGADVSLRRVDFGGIPFFAVSHGPTVSPRQEYVISSSGFWSQQVTSEIILSTHPELRSEHAPFQKGVLAFDILTSVGYSVAAFARVGPYERDTRGMASSLQVKEPWVGALILAPALLDAYRYHHPHSAKARWASRALKLAGVLLILK
jgi:hypothetical protein